MTMRAIALLAAVSTAALGTVAPVWAQGGPAQPVSQAVYFQGGAPGLGQPGAQRAELVNAHGEPAIIPAQYMEACPPGYGGGYYDGMDSAYANVGVAVDQCGPHYFDISAEYLSYKRDSIFNQTIAFTALNFNSDGSPPNLVLTSDAITSDWESGFRLVGRYDIAPLSVLEFGYAGLFNMDSAASVVDDGADPNTGVGNLFSLFTNFGDGFLPENQVDPIEGGFDPSNLEDFEETDRASMHSIGYNSDLQTAEMSLRRYWVGYSPRISGTLLAGFRYTKLKEGFRFSTVGIDFLPGTSPPPTAPPTDPNAPDGIGTSDYQIIGDNNLAGFQVGGDVWACVVQGLRIGAEGKCGLYNNHYELTTRFTTSDGDPSIFDQLKKDQVAFIAEGKLMAVADILPSLSIKGGYEVLFMNSLALVGENFNTASPYDNVNVPQRVAFVADQGEVLFHGWNCGLEYIW